jgi:hypothetical protein
MPSRKYMSNKCVQLDFNKIFDMNKEVLGDKGRKIGWNHLMKLLEC